jgi:hypothetical protein
MKIALIVFILLGLTACGPNYLPKDYPEEIRDLPIGIEVIHNPAEIYATENTKDPEKYGAYQLHLTTTVTALEEDLEIVEFGGYFWRHEQWEFATLYDRPFNPEEFEKWYSCENGELKKGVPYADPDNWLGKGDLLNGLEIKYIMYFIAKNKAGEKFIGASEAVGHMKLKD